MKAFGIGTISNSWRSVPGPMSGTGGLPLACHSYRLDLSGRAAGHGRRTFPNASRSRNPEGREHGSLMFSPLALTADRMIRLAAP